MKKFASEWSDMASWEERAATIKQGLINGMQLNKMPKISENFNTILTNTREMDGYIVENIAIESFPGFYITGNLYRPTAKKEKGRRRMLRRPFSWVLLKGLFRLRAPNIMNSD